MKTKDGYSLLLTSPLLSSPPFHLLWLAQSKIVRVLNLWQKNSVFKSDIIQPLLDMAAGLPPPSVTPVTSQSAAPVNSTTPGRYTEIHINIRFWMDFLLNPGVAYKKQKRFSVTCGCKSKPTLFYACAFCAFPLKL